MKTKLLFTGVFMILSFFSIAQSGWTICNDPVPYGQRIDDIFMVNPQTGYAVVSNGQILKSNDGGDNWVELVHDSSVYCRSVEFINTQKGFVGGFGQGSGTANVLRKTVDGGATWLDITSSINPKARTGICGLAVADSNTIYGCGSWFSDSAYIIKSADGGITWSYINMGIYAKSLIDMYFINKDTGFATGRGLAPLKTAIILYTTDGGLSWVYKYQNTISSQLCWKIQHLTDKFYYASIEDLAFGEQASVLKSMDGGMTWTKQPVTAADYNMEGVGFIDSLKGWAGGGFSHSFETNDGGYTWDSSAVCPLMNRVFKVNDTLLFASGSKIWKYRPLLTGITQVNNSIASHTIRMTCNPNPANENLIIHTYLAVQTRALLVLYDAEGKEIKTIDNANKPQGEYNYKLDINNLPNGSYYLLLKTHEDKLAKKIIIAH